MPGQPSSQACFQRSAEKPSGWLLGVARRLGGVRALEQLAGRLREQQLVVVEGQVHAHSAPRESEPTLGDDVLLHLGGAGGDRDRDALEPLPLHLAVEEAEGIVVEEQALRAEHFEPDLPGQLLDLRVVDAGDRRLDRGDRARRLDRDGAVVQQLGRLDAGGQRGQARPHRGIVGERPPVDHGRTRVLHEVLEHAVGPRRSGRCRSARTRAPPPPASTRRPRRRGGRSRG